MLDGDKIAALAAAFIVDMVKNAGLEDQIKVGIVQTAYANGASTKYLSHVRFRTVIVEVVDLTNRCTSAPSCEMRTDRC